MSDFLSYLDDRAQWSIETFGPVDHQRAARAAAISDHILKELHEIRSQPHDLVEWIDVISLALDGAMRCAGATPDQILPALRAKLELCKSRTWPGWRTHPPGQATEHVRSQRVTVADLAAVRAQELADFAPVYRGCVHCGSTIPVSWVACSHCAAERGVSVGDPIEVRELPTLPTLGGKPSRPVPPISELPPPDTAPIRDWLAPPTAQEALAFLRRTAIGGGSIVSSATMTEAQIAAARAADRMIVTPDGCGFVYMPPPRAIRETLMGQANIMAALAEMERRELPAIMAPRMANDPSPTIADLPMDEEPRRKPPVDALRASERERDAEMWPEPNWQQTAENLREALAKTTAERDDARQDRDASAQELASALCSIRRFEKLFADAGQGEYNVLALVDHYAAQAAAGQDAQRIVRELCALLTVENDGPEGPMPPSWYLGQIRQLLGVGIASEHDAETLDLRDPEWPEPTWRGTAENLRAALAQTTDERDAARRDAESKTLVIRDHQRREAVANQCFDILVAARLINRLPESQDLKIQLLREGCQRAATMRFHFEQIRAILGVES